MAWLFLSFSFRPKEVTRVGRCGSVSYSVSHLKPLGTIWAEFPTVVEIIMIPGLSECIIITIAHHLSFAEDDVIIGRFPVSRRWYNHHWIIGIKLIFGYLIVRLNYYCCFLKKMEENSIFTMIRYENIYITKGEKFAIQK